MVLYLCAKMTLREVEKFRAFKEKPTSHSLQSQFCSWLEDVIVTLAGRSPRPPLATGHRPPPVTEQDLQMMSLATVSLHLFQCVHSTFKSVGVSEMQ